MSHFLCSEAVVGPSYWGWPLARPTVSVAAAAALLAVFIALAVWERRTWSRLRHIPSPFTNSISSQFWLVRHSLKGDMHTQLKRLSDQYGPLVRIGPYHVLTDDPHVIRRINAVRSPYTKAVWYEGMATAPDKKGSFFTADEKRHDELRTKTAGGYAGRENHSLESSIDNIVSQLVALIERKFLSTADGGSDAMNFAMIAPLFALDVMSQLAWGRQLGFMVEGEDMYQFVGIFDRIFPYIVTVSVLPPFVARLMCVWPFSLALPKPTDPVGYGRLMGHAQDAIEARLSGADGKDSDMLGCFISKGLTKDELLGEAFQLIIAGSDSTASALRIILAFLLITPTAYTKLNNEILSAVSKGQITSPVRDAEAKELAYLQAVIKESLRMLPPATAFFYKVAPEGGDLIHSHFVPEGTWVGHCMLGVQRKKAIFGEDADAFRPERWIEASPDRLKEMSANVDLCFGYGKYQCLGRNVAFTELNKVIVELFRRFDFAAVDPTALFQIKAAGFYLISDQWVRITRKERPAQD